MLWPIVWMIVGLVGLVVGGELLVRGAAKLAALAGISPLVVGLTVVAFGTSAPELAVSLSASLKGNTDIGIGNVVGSNIFNVLAILGMSAVVAPLVVSSQLVRIDVPLMVALSFLVLLMGLDGEISQLDGGILFGILVVYLGWLIYQSRREQKAVQDEFAEEFGTQEKLTLAGLAIQLALIAAGLVALTFSSQWLVDGASTIAKQFGMSELLIGLTIVAAGTSLPEAAASVMASIRGERDIAVGNIVGSNIFNICCVLGLSALAPPSGIPVSPDALKFDIPVMIAVAVACLPIFFTGYTIARWEGILFVFYYVAYTTYLVLVAVNSSWSHPLGVMMLGFAVPLTVITLLVTTYRALRKPAESVSAEH
ncbi:calcium/sodium antiporter [Blastopirellula sp. JC732]|uniref:Calcium/sodium antiporter n=1 Tax=Blastopirellula sediminis TaxID=2894196 RepID=A0A9X1MPD7_9BACT|nr:calcium/sodium antiporter [Blastopirellula sediminis]MCC9607120.1 calcium/sodium antiporter [Blastopirellula sediminis]MCC9629587.1 calcium/sodium antiporter [Blastopirellula sediminis]